MKAASLGGLFYFAQFLRGPGYRGVRMREVAMLAALAACSGVSSDPEGTRVLAGGLLRPADVAVGGGTLYVIEQISVNDQGTYDIKRMPTDGSGFPESVDGGNVITAIAADDAGAYWIDDDAAHYTCNVKMYDGSSARTLGTTASGIYCSFRNIAVGSDAVYFSDDMGKLWRVPKSGSGAVQIGMTDTNAASVALDSTGVWVSTLEGVKHVTFAGVESATLLPGGRPDSLASDGDNLYGILSSGAANGTIVHAQGGTTLASVWQPFQVIALNGRLYGAGSGGRDGVWTVAETGGDLVVLRDESPYGQIAVDADGIYFADNYRGQVLRIAP